MYAEQTNSMVAAIEKEKQLKRWIATSLRSSQ